MAPEDVAQYNQVSEKKKEATSDLNRLKSITSQKKIKETAKKYGVEYSADKDVNKIKAEI